MSLKENKIEIFLTSS